MAIENTNKYYVIREYKSYDGGVTWVEMDGYKASLYESDSIDCGGSGGYIFTGTSLVGNEVFSCSVNGVRHASTKIDDGQWGIIYNGSVTSLQNTFAGNLSILTADASETYDFSNVANADNIFSGCTSLSSVTMPSGVTFVGDKAFFNCDSLSSVTLPDGVTSIGNYAFAECSGLTSIIIPSGVTSIGNGAFSATSITSITSNAVTAPTISAGTFQDISTGGTLTIGCGSNGYDAWLSTSQYYLGYYNWTKSVVGCALPDVSFLLNYNAKQYDSVNNKIPKTAGQIVNTDVALINRPTEHIDYLFIGTGLKGVISGYNNYFNRTNATPRLTIIAKAKGSEGNPHILANRDQTNGSDNYNWMFRVYSDRFTLHGTQEFGGLGYDSSDAAIVSARVGLDLNVKYDNWTNNTSSTNSFNYGNENLGDAGLFSGYGNFDVEWFEGDFYWIYLSTEYLTDSQIQDVINFNENL